jgi:serine phosphatase RsbU (regulator of sigma subunit)
MGAARSQKERQYTSLQPRWRDFVQRANRAIIASWSKHLGRVGPHAIDVGLAVLVAVAVTIAISVAREAGSRPPDTFAYALGVTIGALVLGRRRWPVGVLVASVVTLQVYYIAGYPGILPAVPLAVALYTAAAAGHLRWSLAVAAWYWIVPLLFAAFGGLGPVVPALNELVRDGALLAAILLLGDAVRSHRALMAETADRLRRAEEDRQREARELSAARVIQRQLLPKELPALSGWRVAAYYQPAREVGGDFYDFLELPDGQLALITGDVTDKGIPAALVMATTHSILRGDAPGLVSPSAMLERANDRLYPDIPAHMFVTCLYAVLDPISGRLRYANAGHNLPYAATADGVTELRATGMPLGAMPGMTYEENEAYLAPGDSILLHSDGLVEAHNRLGEMFGFPRLQKIVENSNGSEYLIEECLTELREFAGGDWVQEDDITLLTLERYATRS